EKKKKMKGPDEPERRRLVADPDVDPVPAPDEEKDSNAKPLSPGVRSRMEQIFDTDLSHVRVHTDEAARTSAKRLGAEAYTVGEDVYFGGSRDPDAGDDALLAHELVHVVQGPSGEGISKPGDPLEQEAEEAAKAVKRGEKPPPVKKRDDGAGVHRIATATTGGAAAAGDDGAQPVAAGAHVPFNHARWQQILNDPALNADPVISQKIAQLETLAQVTAKSKQEVFDATSKSWKERTFVPMHFPGPTYLPHLSVTGAPQIIEGEYLRRADGVREDSAQNQLSHLMYDTPPTAQVAGAGNEFTRSERGTYDPAAAWAEYVAHSSQLHDVPEVVPGQQTSESMWNLNLTKKGFDDMWNRGYVITSGRWRRPAGADQPTSPTDSTDASTRAIMVADYESHHVIPLWLRSASGHPDGDQLANLAPWHKSAHQTNHAWHHATPPNVRAATGINDYREFNPNTPFLLFETEGGNRTHPAGAPGVQLDTSGAQPRWVRSTGGHPIWAPDI
ncbi:MAG: eCIS core domain-containing protein, partial [Gaiellaceae bacterium]